MLKTPNSSKINFDLEILRGFAGLFVVLAHLLDPNSRKTFDAGYYHPSTNYFTAPAHWAVLIFFILSGYVIGITNKSPLEGKSIWLYLKKRLVRIYPIYFISLIVGIIVTNQHYSWGVILSNFAMLQNILTEVIWSVNPAWSLNYEIFFYLCFIPLSMLRIKPLIAFIIFFCIGLANVYLPYNSLISSYSFGFCFWLVGLIIAQNFRITGRSVDIIPMLLYTWGIGELLTLATPLTYETAVQNIMPVLNKGHDYWGQRMIGIDDFRMLPFAFFIIMLFSGKSFKRWKLWFLLIHLYPLVNCYIYFKHWAIQDPKVTVACVLVGLAALLSFVKLPDIWLRNIGKYLGSISYGIYIIHYPILFAFGLYAFQSYSLSTYLLKVFVFFVITTTTAVFLEKILQPRIRDYLFKKKYLEKVNVERSAG